MSPGGRNITALAAVAALAAVGASGCSTRAQPRGHENLNAVLWTQTAAEYRGLARQSYRAAERALELALADPSWTAAVEQREQAGYERLPPAVVLDIDETVLDNSMYQARLVEGNRVYDTETWLAWCREAVAPAVPGALAFTRFAAQKGVAVLYVTNRRHTVERESVENLRREGFEVAPEAPAPAPGEGTSDDRVLTRGENGWDSSDKTARRRAVAERFRVLLLVGDNLGDFVDVDGLDLAARRALAEAHDDDWGTRWFVLPNPQYGSWESALFGDDFSLSDEERLRRKLERLATGHREP